MLKVKTNKTSIIHLPYYGKVTKHEPSTNMPACTASGHSSARKWGGVVSEKILASLFHEKNRVSSDRQV